MQKSIDEMWEMDPPSEENKRLKEFFNFQKPSIMEFVDYCAGVVRSNRGIEL